MIGLGGSHIGQKDKLSDDESIRLMRDAIEGGISFFDNCWNYNDGRSEERWVRRSSTAIASGCS
jgi:uncharacterized protein